LDGGEILGPLKRWGLKRKGRARFTHSRGQEKGAFGKKASFHPGGKI